jgi:hypothetical protein
LGDAHRGQHETARLGEFLDGRPINDRVFDFTNIV